MRILNTGDTAVADFLERCHHRPPIRIAGQRHLVRVNTGIVMQMDALDYPITQSQIGKNTASPVGMAVFLGFASQ